MTEKPLKDMSDAELRSSKKRAQQWISTADLELRKRRKRKDAEKNEQIRTRMPFSCV